MPLRQGNKGEGRRVATQAYPKVRARVLDRHKRLYLVCTGRTHMLFILPVVSICNHNKSGENNKDLTNNKEMRQ